MILFYDCSSLVCFVVSICLEHLTDWRGQSDSASSKTKTGRVAKTTKPAAKKASASTKAAAPKKAAAAAKA